ncbi:Ataxin-3 [Linnemannia gamsii]|uniref:ubiquitinyl hydrolase 1 n=1 Tax=Linnemannia gamsii TaxID=64522 RepID=A0ABQ7K682_9FUNG|nr:Ataxin-3 [Linnemannia gamsii]
MDLVPHIFHEQQEGNLCAQHCLNSLLQGPYFTAIDLADLANQLDQQEQVALDNFGPGARAVKSQNMDDSGFFSVQVLSHALSIWNIQITPWGSKEVTDAKSEPEREAAFICNLNEHWYTLRRFGPSTHRWYDLNSMHPHPQYMSATYLGMTLSQLEAEGYSIFVVRPLGPVQPVSEMTSPSSTSAVEEALEPKPVTPVVEAAKPALTERQEMEMLRRQRQEERERALQNPLSTTSSSSTPTASATTTTTTTADASTTKRTRVDHAGEEVGNEASKKKSKGDLVTTPSFLPRCEVDLLAASMPMVESSSSQGPEKEQSFGGSGYRLGGSPPPAAAAAAKLPPGFEYEQFGEQEDDAEWEMMQEAIALSLASQQK